MDPETNSQTPIQPPPIPPLTPSQTTPVTPVKEPTLIKIIAGIYAVFGALGILFSLLLIIYIIFVYSQSDNVSPFTTPAIAVMYELPILSSLFIIWSILTMLSLIALSVSSLKISSALHKLEIQGYKTAMLLLAIGIFNIVFQTISEVVMINSPSISIFTNGGIVIFWLAIFFLLKSQRSFFININPKSHLFKYNIVLQIIITLLLIVFPFLAYHTTSPEGPIPVIPEQSFDTNTPTPEAKISLWQNYANTEYHFSIAIPQGWYTKIYPDVYTPEKKTLVFSQQSLPQNLINVADKQKIYQLTVFPVSDTDDYVNYKNAQGSVGEFNKKGTLDNVSAVIQDNISEYHIEAEYKGNVFDLWLQDSADPNADHYVLTDIDNHLVSSFKFTN